MTFRRTGYRILKKFIQLILFSIALLLTWAVIKVYSYSPVTSLSTTEIPRHLKDMVIATEDKYFYAHHGIRLKSLYAAFSKNLYEGRVLYGGSTITQQLMKNLFLTNERTYIRKIVEIFLALIFELRFSKDEILNQYLSVVDFGMKQIGVQNASQFYFNKQVSDISLVESAFLAGIISNPPQKFILQDKIIQATATALGRLNGVFSHQYEIPNLTRTQVLQMIKPYQSPIQRGGTTMIPPRFFGVSLYYYADLVNSQRRNYVNPSLRDSFVEFALDAKDFFRIKAIENMGVFNDRLQTNSTELLSSHAFGRAIDISAFQFSDTSRSEVKSQEDILQSIISLAQKYFDIVLTPFNDPVSHSDHIHAEVLPRISCYCPDSIWILGSPAWRWCRKDFRLRNDAQYTCNVCM